MKNKMIIVLVLGAAFSVSAATETTEKVEMKSKIVHHRRKPATKKVENKTEETVKKSSSQGTKKVRKETKTAVEHPVAKKSETLSEKMNRWGDAFAGATAGTAAGAATTGTVGAEKISHNNVLVALEGNGNLSTFTQELKKADYAQQLQYGHENFTIFAPTNHAIAQSGPLTPAQLEAHIVETKRKPLCLRELEGRKYVETRGGRHHVTYEGRHVYIDGVKISSDKEIITDNGVIYIIDQVLKTK